MGSAFADTFIGDDTDDRFDARAGDDMLMGGGGNDYMIGGLGTDLLQGGDGNDTLDADDVNSTDTSDDLMFGGAGDDVLYGSRGADLLDGGEGIDTANYALPGGSVHVDLSTGTLSGAGPEGDVLVSIENVVGSNVNDVLIGDDGRNHLDGNYGNDRVVGGGGHDSLWGFNGIDTLEGGAGNDLLKGGLSGDTFIFDVEAGSRDRIVDFSTSGGDKLQFSQVLQDYSGIHDFNDLLAHAQETDSGVYIDLNGDRPWTFGIQLDGVELANMTPDDLVLS